MAWINWIPERNKPLIRESEDAEASIQEARILERNIPTNRLSFWIIVGASEIDWMYKRPQNRQETLPSNSFPDPLVFPLNFFSRQIAVQDLDSKENLYSLEILQGIWILESWELWCNAKVNQNCIETQPNCLPGQIQNQEKEAVRNWMAQSIKK